MSIRQIMKYIRQGNTFTQGAIKITYYNALKDTFLLDSIFGGIESRSELSAQTIRSILKEKAQPAS